MLHLANIEEHKGIGNNILYDICITDMFEASIQWKLSKFRFDLIAHIC